MLTISLRDFRLHTSEYLDKLPLVLTIRNKPVLTVHNYGTIPNENSTIISENLPKEERIETGNQKVGFCQGHFERGISYPLVLCKKEDINGEVVFEKELCPKCLQSQKREIKNQGGILYVGGVKYE